MALTKNPSPALRRLIDLTTAVCQERLLTTHVRHVLAFVDLVADRLPFDEALDIYVRIMRLTPEQARNVGSRALAELGRRAGLSEGRELKLQPVEDEEDEEAAHEAEASDRDDGGRSAAIFSRLRRRIRGRVQEDLRHRINLAAARTEDALLETHIENALVFIKALGDEASEPEAVELYLDTMGVDEGLGDVIYNRALRTIADTLLPPIPSTGEPVIGVRESDHTRSGSPPVAQAVPAEEPR